MLADKSAKLAVSRQSVVGSMWIKGVKSEGVLVNAGLAVKVPRVFNAFPNVNRQQRQLIIHENSNFKLDFSWIADMLLVCLN